MWYLIWALGVVVLGLLWMIFGTSDLCPSCGLRLTDSDLEQLERQVFGQKSCSHCGARL